LRDEKGSTGLPPSLVVIDAEPGIALVVGRGDGIYDR